MDPNDATASQNPSSLASFKSRLVLVAPFWYRLTQVFLEKRPSNECSSSKKSSPYSTAQCRVPELILVLGSQPAGDVES